MNALERRVLEALDLEGLVAFVCDLIAIRSLVGEETPAQERVAAEMERCGLAVDLWDLDLERLRQHPAYSAEVERTQALGVVGSLGRDRGGPSLIFNGHVDVVPPGDEAQWSYPPWQGTVVGDLAQGQGRIYGRGAVDMKGGLACALYAARALREAGVRLEGRLLIQSVAGEEDGGVGTLGAVQRGYRADGAVVVEPTELMIAPAQAGALNFRITVPGLSAHACLREEGVSAIDKFVPLYQALKDLERARNTGLEDPLYAGYDLPYALSVGTLQAGDWASSVPDRLELGGRYGVAVGEDLDAARRRLEETIDRTAQADPWLREHPPRVEWWGGQFAPASIPTDHPLVGAVGDAFREVNGREARVAGVTYGSDMRLLVNEGHTPALLFGPGDVRQSHRPDEYVPVEDLVVAARTLALLALRFCGGQVGA
jgi:acetylornithine deacetylase